MAGASGQTQNAGHRAGVVIGIIVLVAAIVGLLALAGVLLYRWRRNTSLFKHNRFMPEDEKSFELPPTSSPVIQNGRH